MPTRWLWLVALASLAWRGWMAAVMPLTGDEALFYWWARFLDYGEAADYAARLEKIRVAMEPKAPGEQ